jgi:predicted phosphate transport protein (TIGR00153 family)
VFIDRMVKWLLPKDEKFFKYLSSIARCVVEAADIYAKLRDAKNPAEFQQVAAELRQKEHEADELAHLLYQELDKTFVTPIDREDLHNLTSALDDVIDEMEHASVKIVICHLPKLSEPMRELIRIAQSSAIEVAKCVDVFQNHSNLDEMQVHVVHVNSLENEGDRVYRAAIDGLFTSSKDALFEALDPIEIIRQKDVLDTMEQTIDACEDVMDLISSVVIKNG